MNAKLSLFNVLGVVGALMVPAIVLAQFTANQPLRATDLQQLADRALQVGETAFVVSLQSSTTTGVITARTFTSQGDGMVTMVPGGSSFTQTATIFRTGGSALGRVSGGNSMSLPVRQGQQFSIEGTVGGSLMDAQVNVYWTPLRGNAPVPR